MPQNCKQFHHKECYLKLAPSSLNSPKGCLEEVFLPEKSRHWSFSVTWFSINSLNISCCKFCNKTNVCSPAHPLCQSRYMTSSPKSSSSSRRPPRQTHPPWARRVGERQDLPPPQPWLQVSNLFFLWRPWSGISYPVETILKSAGAKKNKNIMALIVWGQLHPFISVWGSKQDYIGICILKLLTCL